jgi:methionyl aminopeptidase
MVHLKSRREIQLMRDAGRLVHGILTRLGEMIAPGVTTAELDAVAEEMIRKAKAQALFKGVRHQQARFPFPACICASVNEEVVHGIPGSRKLKAGDIISVDCGVRLAGYCGDSAYTYGVGEVDAESRRLLEVTRQALDIAVRQTRPGRRWREVAALMEQHVEAAGFSVVRDFVGHGIGQEMHEDPKVPNYVDRRHREHDFEIRPGMTLAVEPMVTAGLAAVEYKDSTGWTVRTKDGQRAAHFEHTLAVTETGVDVLTNGR